MKRLAGLFGAVILLLGLAACGGQEAAGIAEGESGDYFGDYAMSEQEEIFGTAWTVSGSAHVEDSLCLVELENAWLEPVALDMTLIISQADRGLGVYYVTGQEEELLWTVEEEGAFSNSMNNTLAVAPGQSRLELRPLKGGEAAELAFELRLLNGGGDALQVKMPGELAEGLGELAAGFENNIDNNIENGFENNIEKNLDNIADKTDDKTDDKLEDKIDDKKTENNLGGNLGGNNAGEDTDGGLPQPVSVENLPVELAAGESLPVLKQDFAESCRLILQAALLDIKGDVALVYVHGRAEEQLWSSESGEAGRRAEIVDMGFGLVLEPEPGEGRLEWRSQKGASFVEKLNISYEQPSLGR